MESDKPPLGTIVSNQFITSKILSARSTFALQCRGTILGITRNVFDCIGDEVTSFFGSVSAAFDRGFGRAKLWQRRRSTQGAPSLDELPASQIGARLLSSESEHVEKGADVKRFAEGGALAGSEAQALGQVRTAAATAISPTCNLNRETTSTALSGVACGEDGDKYCAVGASSMGDVRCFIGSMIMRL
jgi:hypothetical protein